MDLTRSGSGWRGEAGWSVSLGRGRCKREEERTDGDALGEVPREVDVNACEAREVVRQKLKRDDVEEALKAVDRLGHADQAVLGRERVVAVIAEDDCEDKEAEAGQNGRA